MDACLTMASVTAVVLPHMWAGRRRVLHILRRRYRHDYGAERQRSPGRQPTLDFFAGTGPILPQDGIFSVAVPGAPLAYQLADRRFGTFGLKKCFEKGAKVAEEGLWFHRSSREP